MGLGQGGAQQHGTGNNDDHDTSDDDLTDDDGEYSDASDGDDDNCDNDQGGLVKKGSALAVATEPESASGSETARNLLDLHGVNDPPSDRRAQVEKSAVIKKAVLGKNPAAVLERKAVVVEKSVVQKKAIEPSGTQFKTVRKVMFEKISKIIPSESLKEAEDKTDAIKKVNLETTPLKKHEAETTASKNVDPAWAPHASSEMNVKISEPKKTKAVDPQSPRMVSSRQRFPFEVVELKKNTVVKKPSPSNTDAILVAVESEDVEVAKGSKAKALFLKVAATKISITKQVERETTVRKKAKSEDVEVVKDPKVKMVLAKKSNTSELKSIKKV
ncbi:hypothetical protein EC957_001287 [Mortierella hygrophila]|uniref:Uncharacterized protein n=1 Tax=Mortierella hygrophila TaxID=979708 RepID=A0A9P6F5S1_9FUNG|nr:hypothetical protein EC957_001287 [Mortierella hygrophila]